MKIKNILILFSVLFAVSKSSLDQDAWSQTSGESGIQAVGDSAGAVQNVSFSVPLPVIHANAVSFSLGGSQVGKNHPVVFLQPSPRTGSFRLITETSIQLRDGNRVPNGTLLPVIRRQEKNRSAVNRAALDAGSIGRNSSLNRKTAEVVQKARRWASAFKNRPFSDPTRNVVPDVSLRAASINSAADQAFASGWSLPVARVSNSLPGGIHLLNAGRTATASGRAAAIVRFYPAGGDGKGSEPSVTGRGGNSSRPPAPWRIPFSSRGLLALMLFAVLILIWGCASNNPTQQPTPPATQPTMTLSVSSLDFGGVPLGRSSPGKTITVTNASGVNGPSATVSQVNVTGAGFGYAAQSPVSLLPGQSMPIYVTFSPAASGQAIGSLSISIRPLDAPVTVPLSGNGLPGLFNVVGSSVVNFGNVNVGNSLIQMVKISATGADVTVNSAAVSGAGYSFSGISFPTTITAGQSISFPLTFAPQLSGNFPGSITFTTNASNSPTTIQLTGAGIPVLGHSVTLSWFASTTSTVIGYWVYRGQPGGPYTRINASATPTLTYIDNAVLPGATYEYVVTATVDGTFGGSGESIYSNPVDAVIPTP